MLRGTRRRSNIGLNLTGALATFTHTDIRIESGVNSMTMETNSTFSMGTLSRNGGVLSIGVLGGQTYNVGNTNVNGILGPWAILSSGSAYLRNNGSGAIEALPTPTVTTESAWTAATSNYQVGTANLTADRFANTLQSDFGRMINLGSSGDNDLTINGFMAIAGSWIISRSGTSTGKLIIGDTGELVFAGSAGVIASVPIVNGTGAGRLTLAPLSGTVTLSGDNTYSGGTVFSPASEAPTLNINSTTALGSGAFSLFNNSGGAGSRVLAAIDNSSATDITLANSNAQYWNGDFRFIGTHNLNMGTGNVSLGQTPGLNGARTVQVDANTLTIGGTISDGTYTNYPVTTLAKTGAGTLELTVASTYTGPTTISAGTLKLGASGSLTSTNITVSGGATLQLNGSGSLPDDNTTLYLSGTNDLSSGVTEFIGVLFTNGVLAATGTWGSSLSGATYNDDTLFAGLGKLSVGPKPKATVVSFR